jgi:two-component system, OmpR family, KDP operon response regulator KdpE
MTKVSNTVLIIDDEPKVRRFLQAGYELHGFSVLNAENGGEGLKAATLNAPDLIVLDLMLPDMGGETVLERLRGWSNTPAIILSADSDEATKVRLLRAGADDYIVKPFGIAELLARSEAALRRYYKTRTESPLIEAGRLTIDLVARTVTIDGRETRLTRKEYRLLHVLATHVGLVVTHDQLLREVWNDNQRDNIQYLRILIRKLRQKIELDPNHPTLLTTESGVGYRLRAR